MGVSFAKQAMFLRGHLKHRQTALAFLGSDDDLVQPTTKLINIQ
jgi:hypothetical protein